LSNVIHAEQNWLNIQQNTLSQANQILSKLNQLIQAAQNEGKDVSGLKSALAALSSMINNAQSDHNTASQILAAHKGFDDSGNVINRVAAHGPAIAARQSLYDAHITIVQAATDLKVALLVWSTKNHPSHTPTTTGS
jgi:hypothetical protein